jgi:transposase InsO family protein
VLRQAPGRPAHAPGGATSGGWSALPGDDELEARTAGSRESTGSGLHQDFGAAEANVKWASDITYLWTGEGGLYLAVVLDLFSRRVVGWSMQASLDRSLVLNALQAALSLRQPGRGLLHHSDRGSQDASADFQTRLSEQGIQCSMSRRGNCCYDNAVVESFFGTLKQEMVNRRW